MPQIRFEHDAIEIDAAVIAEAFGIEPDAVRADMHAGKITSLCERGVDDDAGTFRLSFFSEHKRFRVVVNEEGEVVRRSTLNSPARPLPKAVRRPHS